MTKTILVVDDSKDMRKLAQDIIITAHPNATIIYAVDREHAWDVITSVKGKVDLMICNVGQSQMTGVELIAKVREKYPDMRTILLSGGIPPKSHKAHAFLKKPFEITDFLNAVKVNLNP